MSDIDRLLPPSATTPERAIETVIAERTIGIEAPIATLWNVDTCPEELLPWMAWAFSVEVWDHAWAEAVKRNVIRTSIQVHRMKGTRRSVELALQVLGFNIDIVEGWQDGSAPHTFRLDAYGDDVFAAGFQIDAKLLDTVTRLIENVKPVRSQFSLRIGEGFNAAIHARQDVGLRLEHSEALDALSPENLAISPIMAHHKVTPRIIARDSLDVVPVAGVSCFVEAVVFHILYGQSLAGGSSSGRPYSKPAVPTPISSRALMFNGGVRAAYGLKAYQPENFTEFAPSFEVLGPAGQLSDTGMTTLAERLVDDGAPSVLVSAFGQGGAPYPVIEEGTQPFANMVYALERAKALTEARGQALSVPAIHWRHGESEADETAETYLGMLRDFRGDAARAVRDVIGQDMPPLVVLQQINRTPRDVGTGAGRWQIAGPPEAVMQAVITDEPGFICVGPQYPGEFVDGYHMTPESYNYMASQSAKAFSHQERTGAWKPLHMDAAHLDGAWVVVEFSGSWLDAGGAVQIDASWVSDPGGFGFVFRDDHMSAAVTGAELLDRTRIGVKLDRRPVGGNKALGLAFWSAEPMGKQGRLTGLRSCIRDDDPATCRTTGWALHNYALSQPITVEEH